MPSPSLSQRATALSGQHSKSTSSASFGLGSILGQERLDDRILDHHAVIEHRHVRHAAVAVTRVDVSAEQAILLGRRNRCRAPCNERRISVPAAPHRPVGREFIDEHPDRDAGLAAFAVRHIGDVLAAPEAGRQQAIDELGRLVMRQMREEFAFEPAWQIWAGLRSGDVELRKLLLLLRHSTRPSGLVPSDDRVMAKPNSRDCGRIAA